MKSITTKIVKISKFYLIYLIIVSIIFSTVASPAAYAWKPKTHVYLADQVLDDVLDDNKVSIYRVDYTTGEIKEKIGDYELNPDILRAIKKYPQAYRAGSFGPDAYPDITTGQQLIHVRTTSNTTSNDWLEHIWRQAKENGNSEVLAFATGYLTHAAGDLYGHAFINNYAGGVFEFLPPYTSTAIKHVVMEGYIDKRLAKINNYNVNISSTVKDFIYTTLIKSPRGSHLHDTLLNVDMKRYVSFVKYFSEIRAKLQDDINNSPVKIAEYDAKYNEYIKAASDCAWYDLNCSATELKGQALLIKTKKEAYIKEIEYKQAWIKDIDDGLYALPEYSHELAKALFFHPDTEEENKANKERAQKLSEQYVYNHLLSMAGAPDAAGYFLGVVDKVTEEILSALNIPALKEAIADMKKDLLNYLLENAFGLTINQIEDYMTSPEQYFDSTFGAGSGQHITLTDFNHNELHIQDNGYTNPDEPVDYKKIPAAYNTVVMSKLLLLREDEVDRLWRDMKFGKKGLKDIVQGGNTISSKKDLIANGKLPKNLDILLPASQNTNSSHEKPVASTSKDPNVSYEKPIILGVIDLLDGSNQWLSLPVLDENHREIAKKNKTMFFAQDSSVYTQIFMHQTGEKSVVPFTDMIKTDLKKNITINNHLSGKKEILNIIK